MIKVIKEGNKTFYKICPFCGCYFSYENEDVVLGIGQAEICCPQCERKSRHSFMGEPTSAPRDGQPVPLPYIPSQTTPTDIPPYITITY